MAHISVRTAILDRFPSADLGVGIFAALIHVAYHGHRDTLPYTSLRDWLHSLEWPPSSAYKYLGDYPEDSAPGWTNNIQGVTSDGSHWFFTEGSEGMWKFPLSHDLDKDIGRSGSLRWPSVRFLRGNKPTPHHDVSRFESEVRRLGEIEPAIFGAAQPMKAAGTSCAPSEGGTCCQDKSRFRAKRSELFC
jgi:hypothetical protein